MREIEEQTKLLQKMMEETTQIMSHNDYILTTDVCVCVCVCVYIFFFTHNKWCLNMISIQTK